MSQGEEGIVKRALRLWRELQAVHAFSVALRTPEGIHGMICGDVYTCVQCKRHVFPYVDHITTDGPRYLQCPKCGHTWPELVMLDDA